MTDCADFHKTSDSNGSAFAFKLVSSPNILSSSVGAAESFTINFVTSANSTGVKFSPTKRGFNRYAALCVVVMPF